MTVNQAAAEGFERGADAYERGRPGYPEAGVRWMLEELHVSARSTVVDLGAGTGKLTRLLVPSGAQLIAIEPVPAMRRTFARMLPGVTVVDGTAESMPLAGGSVDAVMAAQAFHWFATRRAVDEIHRVLRPNGGLGLIWNRRDLHDPLQASLDAIVQPHRGAAPAHERDQWRQVIDGNPCFEPAGERQFQQAQPVDADGVVDRVLSTSFIASLREPARSRVIQQVRDVVRDHSELILRYVTDVFLFRRA
ncbi:MAG TPA: class I SAM-dependent methyltransferase [Candidatus Dormibacteraeota bacterium]